MTDLVFADDVVATAVVGSGGRRRGGRRDGARARGHRRAGRDACGCSREIWGRSADNPPVPPELLRAFSKAGNYIAGAFAGDELVGATIAFHSTPERHALHSHIAGVAPGLVGRSVGYAMKLHQRGWALARGIDVIEWTFDPLVARNAYFNVRQAPRDARSST